MEASNSITKRTYLFKDIYRFLPSRSPERKQVLFGVSVRKGKTNQGTSRDDHETRVPTERNTKQHRVEPLTDGQTREILKKDAKAGVFLSEVWSLNEKCVFETRPSQFSSTPSAEIRDT